MWANANVFRRLEIQKSNKDDAKRCTTCMIACKNLKTLVPTAIKHTREPKKPGEKNTILKYWRNLHEKIVAKPQFFRGRGSF